MKKNYNEWVAKGISEVAKVLALEKQDLRIFGFSIIEADEFDMTIVVHARSTMFDPKLYKFRVYINDEKVNIFHKEVF
jgi:hypothetical protein